MKKLSYCPRMVILILGSPCAEVTVGVRSIRGEVLAILALATAVT